MVETTAANRRELHLFRLYYFVSIGAGGFLLPFLSLFLRRQGLSGTAIGLLGTIQAAIILLAAPFWGRWSDRMRQPRRLIQAALVGTAVIGLILGRQDQFLWIALLLGANALITAGVSPLSDNLASSLSERLDNVGFGSIRLWGSLGWTAVTAVAGRLIELWGLYVAFVGHAAGMVLGAATLTLLPPASQPPASQETTPQGAWAENRETAVGATIGQALAAIRRSPALLSVTIALGMSWLLGSGINQFEAIYLDELGAGETLIGLANALHAAVELPAMLWADRIARRFSAGWLLRVSFIVQAARMVAVLLFPTVAVIMGVRILVGIQFSFFNVGLIGTVRTHSSRTMRATTLALITITLRNLAVMISNPASGFIFDTVGAYWLYGLGLLGAIGGWVALREHNQPAMI